MCVSWTQREEENPSPHSDVCRTGRGEGLGGRRAPSKGGATAQHGRRPTARAKNPAQTAHGARVDPGSCTPFVVVTASPLQYASAAFVK